MRFSLLIFLLACASVQKSQERLYQSYNQKNYQEIDKLLESEDYTDEENKLLGLLERGSTRHYQKRYPEALEDFYAADQLVTKLYTKSIKELIVSGFVGDEAKSFYGKVYERSALYHMQVKTMYLLYQEGKYLDSNAVEVVLDEQDRRVYLRKAASVVLAWNSFFEDLQRTYPRNNFIYDYNQKILSALVHEELGSKSDLNTALILYENLLANLEKHLVFYPKFNESYEAAYESFVAKNKVDQKQFTPQFKELRDFVVFKILYLIKMNRPYAYKKALKRLDPDSKMQKKLSRQGVNVTYIYDSQVLGLTQTKTISYNLSTALDAIEDPQTRDIVETVGISTLSYFAFNTLGLVSFSGSRNGRYVYSNLSATNEITKNIGIDFKIPYQQAITTVQTPKLELKGAQHLTQPMKLFNSYEDKKYLATKKFAYEQYWTLGPKIAIKYLVAIAAAYTTYKQLERSENPFAGIIAAGQYVLSAKAIAATQSVDTRHWIGLPENSFFVNETLPPGEYNFQIQKGEDSAIVDEKTFTLKSPGKLFFL